MRFLPLVVLLCAVSAGCGTTKWTDTRRTAMEQLLISDAMDRAVSQLDFKAVAGRKVYLDATPLAMVTDSAYLVSVLRQHMLSSGCIVQESRSNADYVVEVRAGAVGTDRREVVFGVPAARIPAGLPVPGIPSNLPEMPLATRTEQRAVAKLAAFAYNRNTGRPVWQSGVVPVESTAKHIWVLGAGPFERGTIHDGTRFVVGDKIKIPLITPNTDRHDQRGVVSVADEAFFSEPEEQLAEEKPKSDNAAAPKTSVAASSSSVKKSSVASRSKSSSSRSRSVVPAAHTAPATSSKPLPPKPKPPAPKPPAPKPPAPKPPAEQPPVHGPPAPPAATSEQEPAKLPAGDNVRPLPTPPRSETPPVVDRRRSAEPDGKPLARAGAAAPDKS